MNPVPFLPVIRRIVRLYHTSFLESEDLVQEACLSLLEWDAPPDVDFEHQLSLRIHRAIQSAIRQYEHPNGITPEEYASDSLPFSPVELADVLDECRISTRTRQMLNLYYGLDGSPGLCYNDIAEILGVQENTVKVTLHRAKEKIRKKMHFFE